MDYKLLKFALLFQSMLFLLTSCATKEPNIKEPVAQNGILDLSSWDFNKNGVLHLNGEWKFIWKTDSAIFSESNYNDSHWKNEQEPSLWSRNYEKYGYAWYRLKIINNKEKELCISHMFCLTAYSMYVNGKELLKNGTPGKTKQSSIPQRLPLKKAFTCNDTITIALFVSNFHDTGGLLYSPTLGLETDINSKLWKNDFINFGILGVLFIMILYHFILWLGRTKEKSTLFFALFCFGIFSRMLPTNQLLERFFPFANVFELSMKIEFFFFGFTWAFCAKFLRDIFPEEFSKLAVKLSVISGIIFSLIPLFTSSPIYTSLEILYHICIIVFGVYCLYIIVCAVIKKREGALFFFIGMLLLFTTIVNDILLANGIVNNIMLSPFGLTLFIIAQSSYLSYRFAKALTTTETLSQNLQSEVEKKTRNIQQQKEELEKAYLKVREMDRHKTIFFQNITHEFRTPLTLIIGPVQSIIDENFGKISASIKDHLELVVNNAKKLFRAINELLDLAKLDAGKMESGRIPIDIVKFIKELTTLFGDMSKTKKISLRFDFKEDSIATLTDGEKLETILYNLISNAIKFTNSEGEVCISSQIKNKNIVEISIKDTGIGIPKKDIPFVFDRFYQAANKNALNSTGTGLGLSLVKELVKLLNGNISVNSKENEGTEFIIQLPIISVPKKSNASDYVITRSTKESIELSVPDNTITNSLTPEINSDSDNKEKICIIEDNKDMRSFLKCELEKDYHICEATNGKEGFELILKELPDIIISDIMMDVMDGITLCQKVKADDRVNHTPIILLTAKASIENKLEGIETGADDYMPKPFDIRELKARIKNLLEQRTLLQEKYIKKLSLEPTDIVIDDANEKFMGKIIEIIDDNLLNPDFNLEVLAELANMSYINLYRKINNITGCSPSDFVRIIRLKHAATLLKTQHKSELTIAEVAFKTGFKTSSHFIKCFKERYKVSPLEYSKNYHS